MRLLEKKDIDKAKATDRAKEISEGLKISKKVDSLRELKVNEEESLNKWRKETLFAIQKEIADLTNERDEVLCEVVSLRDEISRGMHDVNVRQIVLDELSKELSDKNEQLEVRCADFEIEKDNLASMMREIHDELERVRTHKEEAERIHAKLLEEEKDAKLTLLEAQKVEENALIFKQKSEESIAFREKELDKREQEAFDFEQENMRVAEELRIQRIQLEDQRRTLERAMKRL